MVILILSERSVQRVVPPPPPTHPFPCFPPSLLLPCGRDINVCGLLDQRENTSLTKSVACGHIQLSYCDGICLFVWCDALSDTSTHWLVSQIPRKLIISFRGGRRGWRWGGVRGGRGSLLDFPPPPFVDSTLQAFSSQPSLPCLYIPFMPTHPFHAHPFLLSTHSSCPPVPIMPTCPFACPLTKVPLAWYDFEIQLLTIPLIYPSLLPTCPSLLSTCPSYPSVPLVCPSYPSVPLVHLSLLSICPSCPPLPLVHLSILPVPLVHPCPSYPLVSCPLLPLLHMSVLPTSPSCPPVHLSILLICPSCLSLLSTCPVLLVHISVLPTPYPPVPLACSSCSPVPLACPACPPVQSLLSTCPSCLSHTHLPRLLAPLAPLACPWPSCLSLLFTCPVPHPHFPLAFACPLRTCPPLPTCPSCPPVPLASCLCLHSNCEVARDTNICICVQCQISRSTSICV